VLSNHFHIEGRTRPDITDTWDDEEVAWRWKCAWPSWQDGVWGRQPSDYDIQELLNDKVKLAMARKGLSSLSWHMARIKEPVAKLFNKQDKVTGHFFEARGPQAMIATQLTLKEICVSDLSAFMNT